MQWLEDLVIDMWSHSQVNKGMENGAYRATNQLRMTHVEGPAVFRYEVSNLLWQKFANE